MVSAWRRSCRRLRSQRSVAKRAIATTPPTIPPAKAIEKLIQVGFGSECEEDNFEELTYRLH